MCFKSITNQTNGIELKTQRWTHTPMVTWSSTRELKPPSGRKTAFSTNGAGGYHIEECELIHFYLLVLRSNLSGLKPETLKLIEEKVGKSLEDMGTREKFLNRTAMACAVDQELRNGTSWNRKASIMQKTLSIRQKGHQQIGKGSLPIPNQIGD